MSPSFLSHVAVLRRLLKSIGEIIMVKIRTKRRKSGLLTTQQWMILGVCLVFIVAGFWIYVGGLDSFKTPAKNPVMRVEVKTSPVEVKPAPRIKPGKLKKGEIVGILTKYSCKNFDLFWDGGTVATVVIGGKTYHDTAKKQGRCKYLEKRWRNLKGKKVKFRFELRPNKIGKEQVGEYREVTWLGSP